jgi:hypothetical protein
LYYPCGDKEYKNKKANKTTDSKKVKFSESWEGTSVYSIPDKFPANVTPDGVVGMRAFEGEGEWVGDYYASKYPRKKEVDPTGPKDPPVLSVFEGDHPGYRVLRRSLSRLTERSFGLDANDAGIYSFRVLMEVDDPNCEEANDNQNN